MSDSVVDASARADFVLLGHPANAGHLAGLGQRLRWRLDSARMEKAPGDTLAQAFATMPVQATPDRLAVRLPNGSALTGRLVVCTFLPEALQSPVQMLAAAEKIRAGLRMGHDLGAKIAGLGGFTSILTGTSDDGLTRDFGLAVTSGNTLTAALALEQLESLLARLGWRLCERTAAILGATGDIGRACTLALVGRVRRLVLVGRNRAKLEALRAQLPARSDVRLASEPAPAVEASLIVAATSAPRALLAEADLRPGTVVCDIGYPKTLACSPYPRPDTLIFSGGLAETPFAWAINAWTGLPTPRLLYGCFTEPVVLAMAGRFESYSAGQGRITLEKMQTILSLARAHGFKPAPLYRGDRPITDVALDAFLVSARRAVPLHV